MNVLNAILTIIFYGWLFAMLFLFWRGQRNATKQNEAVMKSAEAAKEAAEAAKILASVLEKQQT